MSSPISKSHRPLSPRTETTDASSSSSSTRLPTLTPPCPAVLPSLPSTSASPPFTFREHGTIYDSPRSLPVLSPKPPPLHLDHPFASSSPPDPEKGSMSCPGTPPESEESHTDAVDPTAASAVPGRTRLEREKSMEIGKGRKRQKRSDSTVVMTPWQPWKRRRGWTEWMGDTVATPNMVPALVMQAFSTGILDATTYADFSVFASNQTGNAIILSIGFIDHLTILSKLTGASFGSFLLGALVFGQLGHFTGMRRRAWLLFHVFAQACILAIAAVLVSPAGPRSTQIKHRDDWVVIALFAFMSGAQVAMARQSGSQELPTAPMTSSLVDLMADRNILKWFTHPDAGPRNRRLAYVVAMIGGAVLGACIHLYAGSWEVVVVAVFLKVVVWIQLALAGAQKEGRC